MATQDDPLIILREILEREKRVKELRENPFTQESAAELRELIHRIRKDYRHLLLEFPGWSYEKKDVMGLFWKNCFYKHIEEFRKSLKLLKGQLDTNRFNQKLISHMARLGQEFSAFLNDSIRFISELMDDFERKETIVARSVEEGQQVINAVCRCLLYLGDLSRYRELYSESEQKDFSESVRYYERAALLMPSSGNPHNQLAMLATYSEAESTALYHYCRSVMTDNPFSGGFDNLARLFILNKTSFDSLKNQFYTVPATMNKNKSKNKRANETSRFKFFLTAFVRLHGLFFAWTIRMHFDYLQCREGFSQDSSESSILLNHLNESLTQALLGGKEEIDVEEAEELMTFVLSEFEELLSSPKLTDLHLLRLIATCIFSVHFSGLPESPSSADGDLSSFLKISSDSNLSETVEPRKQHSRSVIQCLALSMSQAIVSRAIVKSANQNLSTETKNQKVGFGEKSLPMTVIFCEWLNQHSHFLQPVDLSVEEHGPGDSAVPPAVFAAPSRLTPEKWKRRFTATNELLRKEARSRSSLRSAFSLLRESLSVKDARERAPPDQIPLREHAELRGYLPVKEGIEKYFCNFDPLKKRLAWLGEARAAAMRRQILHSFVTKVLAHRCEGEVYSSLAHYDTSKAKNTKTKKAQKEKEISEKIQNNDFPALSTKGRESKPNETSETWKQFKKKQSKPELVPAEAKGVTHEEEDEDDLDDVVFRPLYRKEVDALETEEEEEKEMVSLNESGMEEGEVSSAILTSLGIPKSKSLAQLSDSPFPSKSVDIWAQLGVRHLEADDSKIVSLELTNEWNHWNRYPPAVTDNSPPGLDLSPSSSALLSAPPPPGLQNSQIPVIPSPPGLKVTSSEEKPLNFLSYLKSGPGQSSFWNS